jgi:hypothetical protein
MMKWTGSVSMFFTAVLAASAGCTPDPAGTGAAPDAGEVQAAADESTASAGLADAGFIIAGSDRCEIPLSPVNGVVPSPIPRCLSTVQLGQLMWKSFIAINWPADTRLGRGVAADPNDSSAMARTGVPRVWETWKADWELDPKQGHSSDWNSYEVGKPPCKVLITREGQRLEVNAQNWPTLYPQYGGLLQDKINLVKRGKEGSPALTGPLIDANREYLRYGTHFSKELYVCARSGEGDGCVKAPDSFTFPAGREGVVGSISVKTSWRKVQDASESKTYHTRDVLVLDYEGTTKPYTAVCRQETMAMLGMHVVYKNSYVFTNERGQNQWVWATFEHRGNAQACGQSAFGFNGPRGFSHEPKELPAETPLPPPSQRTPVMLCRTTEVPFGVPTVNDSARQALPAPWNQYEMVNIQWLLSGQPSPTSSVANVTLEPYAQADSCMGCHGYASGQQASKADYVWAVALDLLNHQPTPRWKHPLWR